MYLKLVEQLIASNISGLSSFNQGIKFASHTGISQQITIITLMLKLRAVPSKEEFEYRDQYLDSIETLSHEDFFYKLDDHHVSATFYYDDPDHGCTKVTVDFKQKKIYLYF